jgi:hypothetical protein
MDNFGLKVKATNVVGKDDGSLRCFFANSIASFSAGGWKPWPTYFEASISSGTD